MEVVEKECCKKDIYCLMKDSSRLGCVCTKFSPVVTFTFAYFVRVCVCGCDKKREREIKRKAVVSRDVTLWVVWLFHFGSAARFEWWWWGGVMQFFPTAVWCRNVLRQRLLWLWGYGIVSRVWWCAHTHALVAGSYPLILLQCALTAGGRL